eukprot:evm.model.scf_159.3 EVM.evm.TU.scf_159.3   scf_159:30253-30960(+)
MAASDQGERIEQTVYICREVHLYKVPPRAGAHGYRSGDWHVGDNIFDGRLRVVAIQSNFELRIEDPNTGELFAMCPFSRGERGTAVEPVTDSSRYFVLRIVDPASGRHAFIGMGFDTRGDAFDFSAALDDQERQIERARQSQGASSTNGQVLPEIAALHQSPGDLSLKEGQTIHVKLKNAAGGGTSSGAARQPVKLMPLAPPPATASVPAPVQSQTKTEWKNPAPTGGGDWATFD